MPQNIKDGPNRLVIVQSLTLVQLSLRHVKSRFYKLVLLAAISKALQLWQHIICSLNQSGRTQTCVQDTKAYQGAPDPRGSPRRAPQAWLLSTVQSLLNGASRRRLAWCQGRLLPMLLIQPPKDSASHMCDLPLCRPQACLPAECAERASLFVQSCLIHVVAALSQYAAYIERKLTNMCSRQNAVNSKESNPC